MKNRIYSSLVGLCGLLAIAGCSVSASEHTQLANSYQSQHLSPQKKMLKDTEIEVRNLESEIFKLKKKLRNQEARVKGTRSIVARGSAHFFSAVKEENLRLQKKEKIKLRREEATAQRLRDELYFLQVRLEGAKDRVHEIELQQAERSSPQRPLINKAATQQSGNRKDTHAYQTLLSDAEDDVRLAQGNIKKLEKKLRHQEARVKGTRSIVAQGSGYFFSAVKKENLRLQKNEKVKLRREEETVQRMRGELRFLQVKLELAKDRVHEIKLSSS